MINWFYTLKRYMKDKDLEYSDTVINKLVDVNIIERNFKELDLIM